MDVGEFEIKAKTIVEIELKNIATMVKKVKDAKAKKKVNLLGLSAIDQDIKNNLLAFDGLNNFVANMILERVEGKTGKMNYEQIIAAIL
jgi:hypothetical protein